MRAERPQHLSVTDDGTAAVLISARIRPRFSGPSSMTRSMPTPGLAVAHSLCRTQEYFVDIFLPLGTSLFRSGTHHDSCFVFVIVTRPDRAIAEVLMFKN